MSQAIARTVAIIGGHGNVALHLAKLISSKHKVISVIRTPDHSPDITAAGAKPVVMSLESDPKEAFTKLFENESAEVVVFSAGAGGKGAEERTKAVDYEGAVKIFDAIDGVDESKRPRLILVSAVDIRDPNIIPDYYVRKTLSSPNASITIIRSQTDEDKTVSERVRKAIPAYMHWKYEADKILTKRTSFKWTLLRPGGLNNNPSSGKVSAGRTHITTTISVRLVTSTIILHCTYNVLQREDVAKALAVLVDRPDAEGLALDIVGGEDELEGALDKAIKNRVTAWVG